MRTRMLSLAELELENGHILTVCRHQRREMFLGRCSMTGQPKRSVTRFTKITLIAKQQDLIRNHSLSTSTLCLQEAQ